MHRTRAADLIQRIEAAVRAARAEAVRQRLGRVAELRTRQVANGWAEVWVVEDVEELASEAELHSVGEMKLTLEGDVRLRGCEAAQHIPRLRDFPRGQS